jgi:hypothetical protein
MNPDFIPTVDFFTRESPTRNIEKKNIFRENPVEVRSFDGMNKQEKHRSSCAIYILLIPEFTIFTLHI